MTLIMMDSDSIIFNSCAFLVANSLFQYGADVFIKNTAMIARRFGASETVVALFAAALEWEELVVVIATIVQKTPSLGLGNIIGSAIGNILGALSLRMLFYNGPMNFDRTAKIFSGASFVTTSMFTLLAWRDQLDIQGGIFLLVAFFVYIFAIGSALYEGMVTPPDIDDSDGERNLEDIEDVVDQDSPALHPSETHAELHIAIFPSVMDLHPTELSPLMPNRTPINTSMVLPRPRRARHSAFHHMIKLLLGTVALFISGFVLVHSVTALATALNLSNLVAGLTILSFATTIPEILMSISRENRLRSDLVVASTAGANIFLLTLCIGIILLAGNEHGDADVGGSVIAFEFWTCWGCSLLLMFITWVGGNQWMGALLLGCYGGYLGCELTVFNR